MSTQNQPAPKRITITVPYRVFIALSERANQEGRSTSNLAAFLLENALAVPIKKPADSPLRVDSGQRGYPPSAALGSG